MKIIRLKLSICVECSGGIGLHQIQFKNFQDPLHLCTNCMDQMILRSIKHLKNCGIKMTYVSEQINNPSDERKN